MAAGASGCRTATVSSRRLGGFGGDHLLSRGFGSRSAPWCGRRHVLWRRFPAAVCAPPSPRGACLAACPQRAVAPEAVPRWVHRSPGAGPSGRCQQQRQERGSGRRLRCRRRGLRAAGALEMGEGGGRWRLGLERGLVEKISAQNARMEDLQVHVHAVEQQENARYHGESVDRPVADPIQPAGAALFAGAQDRCCTRRARTGVECGAAAAADPGPGGGPGGSARVPARVPSQTGPHRRPALSSPLPSSSSSAASASKSKEGSCTGPGGVAGDSSALVSRLLAAFWSAWSRRLMDVARLIHLRQQLAQVLQFLAVRETDS